MENGKCKVLVNRMGQHSLWPFEKNAPRGWAETGAAGSFQECTEWVDRNWRDIRPRREAGTVPSGA
jgi:MbtH protein